MVPYEVILPYCNCVSTTSTTIEYCRCGTTVSFSNDPWISIDYGASATSERAPVRSRYPFPPPPDYVLPSLPAMRAQLTPWKGRDYMLRRKV